MSEDKVRRKDCCWSVRAVYILVKLPDVSGPSLGEVGRYSRGRGVALVLGAGGFPEGIGGATPRPI